MNYHLPIYSDEELDQATSYPPLENGIYNFTVIEREQGMSKNNNPQEKVVLEVEHRPGAKIKCFHSFTFNDPSEQSHKWLVSLAKKFLDCIGVEYTPDAFDHVKHKTGTAEFLVNTYKAKDGSQRERFVIPKAGFIPQSKINTASPNEPLNDDIPF